MSFRLIKHFVLTAIVLLMLNPASAVGRIFNESALSSIRQTPPAPTFTDAERQSELAKRRAAVAGKMSDNSLMILFSAEPKNYTGDVDFYYRQENNLYYLTNLKQKNATLVLIKENGGTKEILFMPKRNPATETWNGKMYSREQAENISGIKTIADIREFVNFIQSLKDKKPFMTKDQDVSIANFPPNLYLLIVPYRSNSP